MTVKLIDVTLRESVHVEGVPLSLESAVELVDGLSQANVNFIEIGYLESMDQGKTYLPEYSPFEYVDELARNLVPGSSSRLVLMIRPSLYEQLMLECMKHAKVGMIRLCIPLHEVDESLQLIDSLKQEGITVSANLIRASHASLRDIVAFAKKVEFVGADYMYLADSNGAMLPDQVFELYQALYASTSMELGFHPHNNLHLASANALEAIKAGATSSWALALEAYGSRGLERIMQPWIVIRSELPLMERSLSELHPLPDKLHLGMVKMRASLQAVCGHNAVDVLPDIQMPTLLLFGKESVLLNEFHARKLSRGLRSAREVYITRAGMRVFQDNHEETIRCIQDFAEAVIL